MYPPARYLFGPVPSRRLGRSLGIDLFPAKTCTLDCVFCQLGPTPRRTLERRDYVPTAEVIAELDRWLARGEPADAVTLAGSGEPTLHLHFGEVLAHVAAHTSLPAVLLSNGTLFDRPEVRVGAARAAAVKVTVSAWNQASFERLHRPAAGLDFRRLIDGLRTFRRDFRGRFWVEVMLVRGINSAVADVSRIAAQVDALTPERVHLNTVIRPPSNARARAVDPRRLQDLAGCFHSPVEVLAPACDKIVSAGLLDDYSLVAMLARHPCTARDVAALAGLAPETAAARLDDLARRGRVRKSDAKPEAYYHAVPENTEPQ